ncbi:MAG: helix-turn-helix transcriptional regulator [Candidatus Diapherotrites archaeon]|nr:helix-turn-helix transcriptional regulator [Candidatus Diapherotrites archaeon]
MIPEREYIKRRYIIRDMRYPTSVKLTKNSLLRWFCLSIGLLSEDESRQSVVPILDAFLHLQLSERRNPTIPEIAELAKQPEKAVRYHMNKLVDLGIVETNSRQYRFVLDEQSDTLDLVESFKQHFSKNVEKTLKNIEKAVSEIQRQYSQG